MRFDLVIFDMDGVLVDSEVAWWGAEADIFQELGVTKDAVGEVKKDLLGLKLNDMVDVLRRHGVTLSHDDIRDVWGKRAKDIYEKRTHLLPGTRDLVEKIHKSGTTLAIGSSSPQEWIEIFLDAFSLRPFFSYAASAQTLGVPGKPDPAIYTHIMEHLGFSNEQTIIFEDSERGFASAKASGATAVAVPDERWCHGCTYEGADLVADSLADTRVYNLLEL